MDPRVRGDNANNDIDRCSERLTTLGVRVADRQYFQLIQTGRRHEKNGLVLMGLGQRTRDR